MAKNSDLKPDQLINNNLGKFFNPGQSYMGYVFIGSGIFASFYSLWALLLLVPGVFIAYTYTGTIIDPQGKKVRPYTMLFGLIRTGKWIELSRFSGFKIVKSDRSYSSYSRANVRFDMKITDIRLLLINKDASLKVAVNKFNNFEDAQKEKDEMTAILFPGNNLNNW